MHQGHFRFTVRSTVCYLYSGKKLVPGLTFVLPFLVKIQISPNWIQSHQFHIKIFALLRNISGLTECFYFSFWPGTVTSSCAAQGVPLGMVHCYLSKRQTRSQNYAFQKSKKIVSREDMKSIYLASSLEVTKTSLSLFSGHWHCSYFRLWYLALQLLIGMCLLQMFGFRQCHLI